MGEQAKFSDLPATSMVVHFHHALQWIVCIVQVSHLRKLCRKLVLEAGPLGVVKKEVYRLGLDPEISQLDSFPLL